MRILKLSMMAMLLPFGAQADNFGIGVGVGTLGLEIHATQKLTKNFDFVAGYATLEFDDTFTEEGSASVTADATIDAPRLGVQFFPFSRAGLFFEGGMVFGSPEIGVKLDADANGDFLVDGDTYDGDDIGQISGNVGFANDSAPYALIGWGRTVGGGLGLNFSLGAISYGSAKASLSTDCTYTLVGGIFNGRNETCTQVRTALVNEEGKINDDLKDFELWPFARIGLTYSF